MRPNYAKLLLWHARLREIWENILMIDATEWFNIFSSIS